MQGIRALLQSDGQEECLINGVTDAVGCLTWLADSRRYDLPVREVDVDAIRPPVLSAGVTHPISAPDEDEASAPGG